MYVNSVNFHIIILILYNSLIFTCSNFVFNLFVRKLKSSSSLTMDNSSVDLESRKVLIKSSFSATAFSSSLFCRSNIWRFLLSCSFIFNSLRCMLSFLLNILHHTQFSVSSIFSDFNWISVSSCVEFIQMMHTCCIMLDLSTIKICWFKIN